MTHIYINLIYFNFLGGSKMEQTRPLDALNRARNKRVIVDLKNGRQLIGTLNAFDIHINTVLTDAEERQDGEVKRKLGVVFIRGDTIILISPAD
jgi:small nuclear ribonucleoprotein